MTLKQYLKANKLSPDQFGDHAAITRQTVYNIIWGKHKPTEKTKIKIFTATSGEVKL